MYEELIQQLPSIKTPDAFDRLKHQYSKQHALTKVPRNIDILFYLDRATALQYKDLLLTKPTRTISGVAPLALMTHPFNCPVQAQCTFCPGGPGSVYGDTPKSYPGGSPAHRRGERNHYDPYLQVFNRLEHYVLLHQDFTKVELIIMGGTFPAMPHAYRTDFILYALKAMNDFSALFFKEGQFDIFAFKSFFELPAPLEDTERLQRLRDKILMHKGTSTLTLEQQRNEESHVRCVTFCIETRPDCSKEIHIDDMLRLGATRVELGIQSIYDHVLTRVKRGHDNNATIHATQLLKDSFLKVGYHAMVGLPESTPEMDLQMFRQLFSDPAYMPDALKIYPCLIFKGTPLYEEWKQGIFTPITAAEAAQTIAQIKPLIPAWCRVMRVQRDIPSTMVEAGVEKTNLRQYVTELMKKQGTRCRCIRCREPKQQQIDWENVIFNQTTYAASGGEEFFLSFEEPKKDLLLGFCRLRLPNKPYRPEVTERSVGIRELHVYGSAVGIGEKSSAVQHHGLGHKLMEAAEKIAVETYDAKKMLVISGIGVRPWFSKKLGYAQDGPYVSKLL